MTAMSSLLAARERRAEAQRGRTDTFLNSRRQDVYASRQDDALTD